MGKTTLELLCETVGQYYARDPSRAGVILSDLGHGRCYVSIVRYREPLGRGKYVEISREDKTLPLAVQAVADAWHRDQAAGVAALAKLRPSFSR